MKKLVLCFVLIGFIMTIFAGSTLAHSGRTDSSGGHRDNKNKSGLGSYHYHHGYGPHLHLNGICPYEQKVESPKATTERKVEIPKAETIAADSIEIVSNDILH